MKQFLAWMGALIVVMSGLARADGTARDTGADATHGEHERDAGIACQLSPGGYSNRLTEIEELFASNEETRELEDGYAFRFPGDAETAGKLLALINAERQCCRFFKFELSFEPQEGPVWLRVRGSEDAKALLRTLMQSD